MKKMILLVILSVVSSQLSVVPRALAAAPSFSLAVSPSVLRIDAVPPAQVETEITIDNKSNQKQNLQIRIRNFLSTSSDGKIEYKPEDKLELPDVLIRNKVKIIDRDREISNIEIAPIDSRTLKLKIDVDSSLPHGDYYFSILFISNQSSSNTSSTSYTGGGIATNILLSIGQKGPTNGNIMDFLTDLFITHGPVQFILLLQNLSDHYIQPAGNITITNMFGRDVGRVEIPRGYILANSSRKNEIIWPERFVFGPYKAMAQVKLSDSGPSFTRSILFVAVPTYSLFAISIFVFILIGIYLRVKRKI